MRGHNLPHPERRYNMEYIIRGISFLIIPIIISGVLAFLRQPKKAEKGKVCMPKFFVIFGSISSAIFLVPTIITAFLDEPIWVSLVFLVLSLLGASLILAFVNCRVSYDEHGFTAKNLFGIKRTYTYDQVTAIRENLHESYIYLGKRRVMIDGVAVGGIEFIAYVRKRYRSLHKGQALPVVRKAKHDLFNGNVEDVGGFLFAYISLSVMIVAFAIFVVWYVYLTPNTVQNTLERQVSFTSCVAGADEMVLTSSDREIYKIKFMGEDFDAGGLQAICDGQTIVTTYAKEVTPDDGEDYYSIKAILSGDTYLLSFEETNRWHREEYWPMIFFPIIFAIVWGLYIAGSIIVGRHPKKFSKKVIRLFFKDGYVKY